MLNWCYYWDLMRVESLAIECNFRWLATFELHFWISHLKCMNISEGHRSQSHPTTGPHQLLHVFGSDTHTHTQVPIFFFSMCAICNFGWPLCKSTLIPLESISISLMLFNSYTNIFKSPMPVFYIYYIYCD